MDLGRYSPLLWSSISVLRKEACQGSIHDLAHIPKNCFTKGFQQRGQLNHSREDKKMQDVDIHLDLWNSKTLSTWCRIFLYTREKEVFLPDQSQDLSSANSQGPFQVMFVESQQRREQNELSTRGRLGEDATKITSRIQILWSVMPISMTALTCMVKNSQSKHHRRFHSTDR